MYIEMRIADGGVAFIDTDNILSKKEDMPPNIQDLFDDVEFISHDLQDMELVGVEDGYAIWDKYSGTICSGYISGLDVIILEKYEFVDITDLAMKTNELYNENHYKHIYFCEDNKDYWLVRIAPSYENENGFVVERDKIEKTHINTPFDFDILVSLIETDELENRDTYEVDTIDEAKKILERVDE